VLSGGDADLTEDTSEEQVQALASQSFLALLRTPETQARIEHMLTKGRPLRN